MIIRLGDPIVSAALHVFVGETDAKRGLRNSSNRHARLGLQLLDSDDNLWLRAVAENVLVANCIMVSDIDAGSRSAQRALSLATKSGAAAMRRACLCNLGNLHYLAGDFDKAIAYLEDGNATLPSTGERSNSGHDSLSRVYLTLGRLKEARNCQELIESSIKRESDWSLYGNRQSRLTFTELLLCEGRLEEATASSDFVRQLAEQADDHLLATSALLTKAHIARRTGNAGEFLNILRSLIDQLPHHSPELFAKYEVAIGAALLSTGQPRLGELHFDRAKRCYAGLHNVPGQLELERALKEAKSTPIPAGYQQADSHPEVVPSASNVLQNIATLMLHAGRPELLATGIVAILADTGAVFRAEAVSRGSDGSVETLSVHDPRAESDALPTNHPPRILAIGTARSRAVEVRLHPRGDIESTAALNAITLLLGTVRDLESAHAEREEQLALWPIDELPLDGEHAVIGGCLHGLLTFARRVARTTASVLITGESGTGKEILAKAIHGYSARADKPFIPFNCTAVPREMLESQLFGYRRGAFTGAERDNPGLIRAARGGTLFLDEIGEMSLDLQPKLLRFLESGEISPLGESPLTVDVRIVAATNRNLEQLVQDERFREDLFYRLNVIRLPIPPLRERRDEIPALVHHFVQRAAMEYTKGRVRIAEETMEHLLLFHWPGNIRQLNNEICRMVALAENDAVLKPAALSQEIRRAAAKASARSTGQELVISLTDKLTPTLARIEREMIRLALRSHQGRVEPAAKALGISRKGLYLKRQRLGL